MAVANDRVHYKDSAGRTHLAYVAKIASGVAGLVVMTDGETWPDDDPAGRCWRYYEGIEQGTGNEQWSEIA